MLAGSVWEIDWASRLESFGPTIAPRFVVPVTQCPLCETFWRLYAKGVDNLRDLTEKHKGARDGDDRNSAEMLAHEIVIAESALRSVRLELRRHEAERHHDASQKAALPKARHRYQAYEPGETQ